MYCLLILFGVRVETGGGNPKLINVCVIHTKFLNVLVRIEGGSRHVLCSYLGDRTVMSLLFSFVTSSMYELFTRCESYI